MVLHDIIKLYIFAKNICNRILDNVSTTASVTCDLDLLVSHCNFGRLSSTVYHNYRFHYLKCSQLRLARSQVA